MPVPPVSARARGVGGAGDVHRRLKRAPKVRRALVQDQAVAVAVHQRHGRRFARPASVVEHGDRVARPVLLRRVARGVRDLLQRAERAAWTTVIAS